MTNLKYILIVPDGAGDVARLGGKSPLEIARIPNIDYLVKRGISGLVKTLYDDLPKGSIVAQLGILGYSPHKYYPHGRASSEALAIGIKLKKGDIAFRANLVYMKGNMLDSYNAGYIKSKIAAPLIASIQNRLSNEFPEIELHHNSDFRNTMIMRGANIDPRDLITPEPHENMGKEFDLSILIRGRRKKSEQIAKRINKYLMGVRSVLSGKPSNAIFPWSTSTMLKLPPFNEINRNYGKGAIVGHMDFLHGIAKAAKLDFYKIGNGNWDTDYAGKGDKMVNLLKNGYNFIYCHINAPDEASHMMDIENKVYAIEQIDKHIVQKAFKYFQTYPEDLGGILIVPDHYTNYFPRKNNAYRSETHSIHPVPFVIWNGHDRDESVYFSEEGVVEGRHGDLPINHLDLLKLLNKNRLPNEQKGI